MTLQQWGLHASAASVSILPTGAVALGGSGSRDVRARTVADSIEANVLVLRWGRAGSPIVLISLDLLYVGPLVRERLLGNLAGKVASEDLFIAASHTHHAPMTDPSKPALGPCDEEYVAFLVESCTRVIQGLLETEPRPVDVLVGKGTHDSGVNRRRRRIVTIDRQGLHVSPVIMAANVVGRCNSNLRRLRLVSGETVVADVWSTALHPTASPSVDEISSDFPGVVRRDLRRRSGSGHPVLFFQGFSGNIRPRTPSIRLGLKRLLIGPIFAPFTQTQYEAWAHNLAEVVLALPLEPTPCESLTARRYPVVAEDWFDDAPGPKTGAIHRVDVGNTVMVGVPAEVCNEYLEVLGVGAKKIDYWGIGCVDHVWGYAPTSRILKEGGYEGGGFCAAFGVASVNSRIEGNLTDSLTRAAAHPGEDGSSVDPT